MMKQFYAGVRLLTVLTVLTEPAMAQSYFNNRYPIAAVYSGATTMLPNGAGFVTAGAARRVVGQAGAEVYLSFHDSTGALQVARFYQHHAGQGLGTGVNRSLLRTRDGGLALVGDAATAAGNVGVLWRFGANGDTLWTRVYRGQYSLITRSGCELPDGGFLLVGEDVSGVGSAFGTDALVIRTDSLGAELWRRTWHFQQSDVFLFARPTPEGGYVVTGYTQLPSGSGPTDSDWLVFKLDSAGNTEWQRTVGQPSYNEGANETALTPDGGYLVCGGLGSGPVGRTRSRTRAALIKFDAGGVEQWRRLYGPATVGSAVGAIHALADGGYVLGGAADDSLLAAPGGVVGAVLKVCADGDSVWYRTYQMVTGPNSNNYLRDLVPTADGGFAGAGFFHPHAPDTGTMDVWLFKTDANGYLQAGGAPPSRVCPPPVGLVPPEVGAAVEVWPNPSPDGRYAVAGAAGARLTVRDALGRLVWHGAAAGAETAVDLRAQPAGLYLLRLAWPDGRTTTKKLLR